MNKDGIFAKVSGSRNMLIPWYMMASYAYYWRDVSLLSDSVYDQLCKDLNAEWDSVEHRHKGLINRQWLSAGTCLLPRELYPGTVMGAACALLDIQTESPPPLPKVRTRTRTVQPVAT